MRRQAVSLLLLLSFVGIAISAHPEIIGLPVSNLVLQPENYLGNALILTLYLIGGFAWIRWQKEAIGGGRFARYALSLPVAPRTRAWLDRRMLLNALLPLLVVPLVALVTLSRNHLSFEAMAFFSITLLDVVVFIWRLGQAVLHDRKAIALWIFVVGAMLALAASAAPFFRWGLGLLAAASAFLPFNPWRVVWQRRRQHTQRLFRPQQFAFAVLAWARAWHGYREALLVRWLCASTLLGIAWYASVCFDMSDRYWGFSATACGTLGWLLTGLYLAQVQGDAAMRRFLRTLPLARVYNVIAEIALLIALMLLPLLGYIVAMYAANLLSAPPRIGALLTALPLAALSRAIRFLPDQVAVIAQGGVWVTWIVCTTLLF